MQCVFGMSWAFLCLPHSLSVCRGKTSAPRQKRKKKWCYFYPCDSQVFSHPVDIKFAVGLGAMSERGVEREREGGVQGARDSRQRWNERERGEERGL